VSAAVVQPAAGPRAAGAHEEVADRGAVAVEFALVLPLLLLIIFGIIDFGRMWNMQIALTQSAREGVRVLALGGSSGDAETRTRNAAFPVTGIGITPTACPAVVTPTTAPAKIEVTRSYDYITPVSGILNIMGLPSLAAPTIRGKGEMRCNG
jgi:Flp pilus assembly protein TadG